MTLRSLLKKYRAALVMVVLFVAFLFLFPSKAGRAEKSLLDQLKTMLLVMPPIFVLLGLLDVWVPREMLIRYMGKGSGLNGTALGIISWRCCRWTPVRSLSGGRRPHGQGSQLHERARVHRSVVYT